MSDTPMQEEKSTPMPAKSDPPIKPRSTKSVAIYLVILFAAAFLLLLMAFFMQQRSNDEVIGSLQHSVSQFQTMDELLEENQQLRAELEELEDQLAALQEEHDVSAARLEQLKKDYDLLETRLTAALEELDSLKAAPSPAPAG